MFAALGLLAFAGLGLWVVDLATTYEDARESAGRAPDRNPVAERAIERALDAPATTDRVSPAPDGSRTYASAPAEDRAHAFRLRLPRPWEGRRVHVREHADVYVDSLLTRAGVPGLLVEIERVEPGRRFVPADWAGALTRTLEGEPYPGRVVAPFAPRTVGDGERAYAIDGEYEDERSRLLRLRIVVFEHAGELFRVDLLAPAAQWEQVEPEFERILRSWRWG